MDTDAAPGIGTLQEKSLHAALKLHLARKGDRMEQRLGRYIVDILRGRRIIEIQTRNFSAMKRKLESLTERRSVRLVYPVAVEKWIVKESEDGARVLGRRRSPKRGDVFQVFEELVSIPEIPARRNFSLEVLLIVEETVRRPFTGRRRRWRRDWSSHDRRLVAVRDRKLFRKPEDYVAMLPAGLPETFTNRDLASALGRPRWVAEKMTYVLRRMGGLKITGKQGLANVYRRTPIVRSRLA